MHGGRERLTRRMTRAQFGRNRAAQADDGAVNLGGPARTPSAADILAEPVVVCRASGTCVIPAA